MKLPDVINAARRLSLPYSITSDGEFRLKEIDPELTPARKLLPEGK